ncbi:MAG: cation transport protein ChaC [Myxococcota bacterium]|jgi:cation transport protein ChaC
MSDSWVFGYGSLIWRPSFVYAERVPARLDGWVRRFWQGSEDHRGTPEFPGRVATLLRWPGKSCLGVAYRLDDSAASVALAHLDVREVGGYQRERVPLVGEDGEPLCEATTWVATTANPHFLGMTEPSAMATQIQRAHGPSGSNREYVLELADALRAVGEAEDDQTFALESLLLELQPAAD